MRFFNKKFDAKQFTLYPIGDWHLGSRQCDFNFVTKVIGIIKDDPDGYWVGMGDFMENAIAGSKSDMYKQLLPPREQMDTIVDILTPIREKGLFLLAGNHEQRTTRVVGLNPEEYIATRLGVPFGGFSCLSVFDLLQAHAPRTFTCYFHHNYGGGTTFGGKINRAERLRRITPTADAIFSGHFHVTSRIPVSWYEAGLEHAINKNGYDYITGSALTWNESYAEEKPVAPSAVEHIYVKFVGNTSGSINTQQQVYGIITK